VGTVAPLSQFLLWLLELLPLLLLLMLLLLLLRSWRGLVAAAVHSMEMSRED